MIDPEKLSVAEVRGLWLDMIRIHYLLQGGALVANKGAKLVEAVMEVTSRWVKDKTATKVKP